VRDNEDAYTLDGNGFQIYKHESQEKEFVDDEKLKREYYPETEQLLKDATGASRIFIFDHTIRRAAKDTRSDPSKIVRGPVNRVHIDQSYPAARNRVPHHLPADADHLLASRHQIINVWRPIGNPASDFPLAVVDWRSTKPEDFVKIDLLYPKRDPGDNGDDRGKEKPVTRVDNNSHEGYEIKGETYGVVPAERHKFFYMKDMTPEEAMFIKCFDSRSQDVGGVQGLAGKTPHTAFVDPNSPADAPGRQSIEVRCLVFYE